MVNNSQTNQLKKLFKSLELVSHSPGQIFDLGLVVSNLATATEIAGLKDNLSTFILQDANNHPDFLLKALKQSFKEKKWLLIDWQVDNVNSDIYQLLRQLSADNMIQLNNKDDKLDIIRLPAETRIVVLVHPQRMEQMGDYQFVKLFGPVLNL
jgi:hypothetical protein